jgi:hypothetical protein
VVCVVRIKMIMSIIAIMGIMIRSFCFMDVDFVFFLDVD